MDTKPPPVNETNMNEIIWNDTEIIHLHIDLKIRKDIYNYNKFMIDMPICDSSKQRFVNWFMC